MTASSSEYKRQMAARITKLFFWVSLAAFFIVLIAFLLGLIIPLCFKEDEKVLTAKLTYSATGVLIGALEVVLGILLSLIGLTADYDIETNVGSAKIKLASASPGLLLIICGNLLMGFSLMREFTYKSIELQRPSSSTTASDFGGNAPQPLSPGGPK